MAISGLATYVSHEELVERFLQKLQKSPPPGFERLTIEQLRPIDEWIWSTVAEDCRGGAKAKPGNQDPT